MKNWKKGICNQPYVYNGGINRHTHTCVRRQRSSQAARRHFLASEVRQSQTKLWRAKRVLGEKIWRAKRAFGSVFFFLTAGLPPQKCQTSSWRGGEKCPKSPPPTPDLGMGISPLSREKNNQKCQRTLYM